MNNEEIPYRAPTTAASPVGEITTQDERDYSTLKQLQKDFHVELEKLQSVDILDLKEEEGLSVKEQAKAYRKAKEILQDAVDMVDSAVGDIEYKHQERIQSGRK